MTEKNPEILPLERQTKTRKEKFVSFTLLFLSFLIPFAVLCTIRHFMLLPGESSVDAYYHGGMGKLGPSVILGHTFKWQDISMWCSAFADKELLFHLYVWAIFCFQKFCGIPVELPFNFADAFVMAPAILAFIFAARRMNVRPSLVLAGSILTFLVTPNFTYRFLMFRPHVIALAFMYAVFGVLAKGSFRSKVVWLFILSFFFSWTYSNPHFIVFPVLFHAVASFGREDRKKNLLLALVSVLAVMGGIFIHPQSPDSFFIWKVQSWDALFSPMLKDIPLTMPGEMMPPSFNWYKSVVHAIILFCIAVVWFVKETERKGLRFFSPAEYSVFIMALLFVFGNLLALRSVEYGVPFTILLLIITAEKGLANDVTVPFRKYKKVLPLLLLLCGVVCGVYTSWFCVRDGRKANVYKADRIAEWLRNHTEQDELVVNVDWSDFAVLFYYCGDHNRFMWGMDPAFAYAANPEKTITLACTRPDISQKYYVKDYHYVYQTFKVRYAVLLWPRIVHMKILDRNGWRRAATFLEKGREEGVIYVLDDKSYPLNAAGGRKTGKFSPARGGKGK